MKVVLQTNDVERFMFEHWFVSQYLTNSAGKMISFNLEKIMALKSWTFHICNVDSLDIIFGTLYPFFNFHATEMQCNLGSLTTESLNWEENLYSACIFARINNNHCWTCTWWVSFQNFSETLRRQSSRLLFEQKFQKYVYIIPHPSAHKCTDLCVVF